MPFKPFNYGDTIAQAQGINNLRSRNALMKQELDPDSMQNQLRAAQIRKLQAQAANPGGGDPTSEMKNYKFYQSLGDKGKAQFDHMLRGQNLRKIAGVWHIVPPDGEPVPLSTRAKELEFSFLSSQSDKLGTQSAEAGEMGLPDIQFDSSGGSLGGYTPPSKADIARQVETAQVVGQAEGEKLTQGEQNKQELREADAVNAMTIIDELLATRPDDGGIYASYAYGKANTVMAENLKPQEWIDAEVKRDQLVSMLQLENVAKLKGTGPITEPEQQVLRQAMTVLQNPRISIKVVETELKRVRAMFATWKRQAAQAQGKGRGDETYEQRRARILGQ